MLDAPVRLLGCFLGSGGFWQSNIFFHSGSGIGIQNVLRSVIICKVPTNTMTRAGRRTCSG